MNNEQYGVEDDILGEYGCKIYDAAAALAKALTVLEWIMEDHPDAPEALSIPLDEMKQAQEFLRKAFCNYDVTEVQALGLGDYDNTYREYRQVWNRLTRLAKAESIDAYYKITSTAPSSSPAAE